MRTPKPPTARSVSATLRAADFRAGHIAAIADDAPRLLAALDEVLKLADRGGTGVPPVRIRKAISRALLGEESGNA